MNGTEEEKQQLKDRVKEGTREAGEKLRQKYSQMGKRASEMKEKTTKYARENPEKSMLIAAGVGFLVALLLMGIKKKSNRY